MIGLALGSFTAGGKPIANNLEEALNTFLLSGIDTLVMDNNLPDNRQISDNATAAIPRPASVERNRRFLAVGLAGNVRVPTTSLPSSNAPLKAL